MFAVAAALWQLRLNNVSNDISRYRKSSVFWGHSVHLKIHQQGQ